MNAAMHAWARAGLHAGLTVLWLALALLPIVPAAVLAQGITGLTGGDEPLEINADQGIEWRRNEQTYVARGNASAARGKITVFADALIAHYKPLPGGGSEIHRIDAEGNVRIVSPSETVYGDRGAYDVVNGVLVLVGKDLRLVGAKDVLTARDSLEYWEKRQVAIARGDAEAVREDKRIKADVLTAYFEPAANKDLEITKVDAFGNVRVKTATELARGDRGVYYVQREFATLTGAVKITREENQLNGEYAEVNMATGVSRLLAAAPGTVATTRVQGLIVPKRKPTEEPKQ
ncbi:MAG TPA: LptA/OstA family protein [Kiloniellales bacterium]